MENESFMDSEIAGILNNNFIPVKVDREERPDIDSVYMSVCQALTGSGGWPLTILADGEKNPFFSATYLPKHSRYGITGLHELLIHVTEVWEKDKDKLLKVGEEIKDFLNKPQSAKLNSDMDLPDKTILEKACKEYERLFDSNYGGFGNALKFPSPHNLLFLLSYYEKENNIKALEMAEKTLCSMFKGGIFDHIGGGFSRYSTDEKWLAPHFEKMLYDNALLTLAYTEAFRITKNELYKITVERTLNYVSRELSNDRADDRGGFYCGQDADSDGEEGKFYTFEKNEILKVLGAENGDEFCKVYGITEKGNFEGKNIPNLIGSKIVNENPALEESRKKLYQYRLHRARLHKDDKILTSWNGLMITAFARSYIVFGDEMYLEKAKKAETFISEKLTNNNRLLVRYRDGDSAGTGTLEDYAFYICGLLELYNTCFDAVYLHKACMFAETMTKHFFDTDRGGFFLYADDAEQLIARPKETYDGAMPSGNSMAVYILDKLTRLTGDIKWQEILDKQLGFFSEEVKLYPTGYSFILYGLCNILYDRRDLICVLKKPPENNFYKLLNKTAVDNPDLCIIIKTPENSSFLETIAPFTKAYTIDENEGDMFYLCRGNTCDQPVKSFDKLKI
ncbi:spermatogenesis-associated protein 20 [Holotrichia oblita]|nr:spermatogenesis-associated protein 20 [Holotrichia oblita]